MGESNDKQTKCADDRETKNDPPWAPLDSETERGERGLTALLHHRLADRFDGKLTFAQALTQKLINSALDGNPRFLEEIFARIDGEAKSREPAARSVKAPVDIDQITAQRILDALHDDRDHRAGH